MYKTSNIVVFVNLNDFFHSIEQLSNGKEIYLAVSYDTDMLAMENKEARKAILSKLLGMGNVVVKDDPNLTVMMATRDGIEEGFLGHKAPSGDPLLIVTFNEEMVGEITKIYYDFRSRAPLRQ